MPTHELHPARLPWLFALAVTMVAIPAASETTQGDDSAEIPPGVTSVEEAGEDFALQGEFAGPVSTGPSSAVPWGLQIRAIGDGQFEALQYDGGLPGVRRVRSAPKSLVGTRAGDVIVLSGQPFGLVVRPDEVFVVSDQGKRIGLLDRVMRQSPTLGAVAPEQAVVLFDSTNTDQFVDGRMTEDGLLMEGPLFKPMFQDFQLHLEFLVPFSPKARLQSRGNSGVYLQSRYEVQILDSFALVPKKNDCGALYQFLAPSVNASLPPLTWQTYDIDFTAPRWMADGVKRRNARLTVWHNGARIHNRLELTNKTGAGSPEEPTLLPIRLQNHGNPVRFRNIWVIDRGASTPVRFPVMAEEE